MFFCLCLTFKDKQFNEISFLNSKSISANKGVLTKKIAVKINVYNHQKDLKLYSSAVKKIVKAVLNLEEQPCDEVSVYFVNDQEICRMHHEYFDDPTLTDCISFPLDFEIDEIDYKILGEVFVCPYTAIEYAKKHKVDKYEECALYIIHGLLHLMGYDDMDSRSKAIMRRTEKKHLENLRKLNLSLNLSRNKFLDS